MAPRRHKSLVVSILQKFATHKKPLPWAGRGVFAAIFGNIWFITAPCLAYLIWPINDYDVYEDYDMQNHYLLSFHEPLTDNLIL